MKKGFTLIELLAVLIILAVILLIAVPIVQKIIYDSEVSARKASLDLYARAVNQAIEVYQLNIGKNPSTFSDIEGFIEYSSDEVICSIQEINPDMTISLAECTVGGISVEDYSYGPQVLLPISFNEDDWSVISKAVKSGTYPYQVGDTKEVDMGDFGKHTVRISNTTACDDTLVSQTACGFVLEFIDVITPHAINSTNTNVGGWPASEMRTYINNDIYNALPNELRNIIIDTTVVSGHGSTTREINFITTDKIYLLSTKEVWGKESISEVITKDTAEEETRQLDYYANNEVTTSNYSLAIKRNSSNVASFWWLRTAYNNYNYNFYLVYSNGRWSDWMANDEKGVSPAFRIG